MEDFFNRLFERFKSETPLFFVKLRNLGGSLALVGVSLQTIPNVPANLLALGTQLIVAGGVMAAISQLTVKSPDQK